MAPRPWVSPTAISFDSVGVGTFPESHRARGFHPRLFHSTPSGSERSRNGTAPVGFIPSVGFTHGYLIRPRRGRHDPGIAPRPGVSPTATSFDPVGVGTIPECTASVGFTHGYFIRPRWGRHDPGMASYSGFFQMSMTPSRTVRHTLSTRGSA